MHKATNDEYSAEEIDRENHTRTAEEINQFVSNSQTAELQNQMDLQSELAYREKMRKEQEKRTEEITNLFVNYRGQQEQRYKYKHEIKPKLIRRLSILIGVLIVLLAVFSVLIVCLNEINGAVVVALVSGFITCLSAVLSILLIIVKYIFPEDEDKNFNDLVKSIITNDTMRIKDENDYRLKNGKK